MTALPSWRLLALIALAAPLFLVHDAIAWAANALILVALAVDLVLGRGAASLPVDRSVPTHLPRSGSGLITITIANPSRSALIVRITDDLPPELQRSPDHANAGPSSPESDDAARLTRTLASEARRLDMDVWEARISPGGEGRFTYRVRAIDRGRVHVGDIHLRILGPLGLVWRQYRHERTDTITIQPGLLELRRYRLLAHHNRLREMGLRSMDRGEGSSFESLREYGHGDDPRRIDWKATGKRGALIVRQMEADRSQGVMLAIDAGRLMTEELGTEPGGGARERLDCALSAALLLAEVAAQHGDRVGLFVFSAGIDLYLPPSRAPLRQLATALADVQARMVEPDYPGAFVFLSRQLRRRCLLVLFTDVIDARTSSALLTHAGAVTRKHLPLAVTIRNPALEAIAAVPVTTAEAVYRRAAAEELLQLRAHALATMRRTGVLVADTLPHDAVPTAINRYLEVKRRGRL